MNANIIIFSGTVCTIYIYTVKWPTLMRENLECGNLGKSFQAQGKDYIVLAENKTVGHKSKVSVQMTLSKDKDTHLNCFSGAIFMQMNNKEPPFPLPYSKIMNSYSTFQLE